MAEGFLTGLQVGGYLPAAGGWVFLYQPGTTVQQTVYQDDAGSVVWTQPITLDQNGRPANPVYAAQPVRAIFFSSTGAQLLDVARINGQRAESLAISNASWPGETTIDGVLTALGTTFGGTDGNAKVIGTGAVQRSVRSKVSELPSVKDFGAVGNGIADDFSAILAGITAVNAAGGGTLTFPAGTYLTSQPIALQSGVSLRGVSSSASVIKNSSGTGHCLTITNLTGAVIEDIGIANVGTSTGTGVLVSGCTRTLLSRLQVLNHFIAINLTDSAVNHFNVQTKVQFCDLNTVGVAGSTYCLLCNGSQLFTGYYVFLGNTFSPSNNAISLTGTESSVMLIGNSSSSTLAAFSVANTHSGSRVYAIGNDFGVTSTNGLVIQRTTTFGLVEVCNAWGTGINSAATGDGGNYLFTVTAAVGGATRPQGNFCIAQSFAGNGSVTPDNTKANHYEITCTTAGSTITINNPAIAYPASNDLFLQLRNNSGGAVTWAFGGGYFLSTTVNPTSPNRVNLHLKADASSNFYEMSRATTG
jgi:hypothetical protein